MSENGKKYVVYGMYAQCTMGSMKNFISTDVGHGVLYQGQPLLNANDHTTQLNLTHFGDCHAKSFFGKCVVDTPLPWIFVNKEHIIDGAPALTVESKCACRGGGIISIVLEEEQSSSESTDQEFEDAKQELMDAIKNEPTNLRRIANACIAIWGTETGNKVEQDIFDAIKGVVSPVLAFEYLEEEDYYVTNETYGIQRNFGFADVYDELGSLLGMDLDTEILTYTPDGSDKEYRLQFWKGSYGAGGAYGSEIGLYSRDKADAEKNPYKEGSPDSRFTFYSCVSGDDEIRTVQTILDAHTGEVLFQNDTAKYAENDDHFWNLAIKTDPGRKSEDLVIIDKLYIKDENQRKAIIEEINKK